MVAKHENILPEGWRSTIVFCRDQIESFRPIWEKMQAEEPCSAINADINRYLSVLDASEDQSTPLILLLEQNNQPKAMVIGRREKHAIAMRIGYKTLLRPKLNCMTVVYGGVLGQPDEQVSSLLFAEMKRLLRTREVDIVFFNHLRGDSVFYRQIRRLSSLLCRNYFPVIEPHWRMVVPENIEVFFQSLSKKHRANIKRAIKNFEEKYEGKIEIKEARRNDIECIAQDAEKISTKTYQHSISAGFLNEPLTQSIMTTDANLERLRMSILYIDDEPCAFQWGTIVNNVYFLEKIGFDPEWSRENIGSILFIKNLERLCDERSVMCIDFGFGDAQYKKSYGDDAWPEAASTYVFAFRLYPILINMLNGLNSFIRYGLTWFFQKTQVQAWTKRVWRRKLKDIAVQNSQEK